MQVARGCVPGMRGEQSIKVEGPVQQPVDFWPFDILSWGFRSQPVHER